MSDFKSKLQPLTLSGAEAPSYDRLREGLCCGVIFLIVLLCYAWDAPKVLDGTFGQAPGGAESGDTPKQVAFVLLFAAALAALFLGTKPRLTLVVPGIFFPILTWCWLSIAWAVDPGIAFRRIAFTTIVIITVAICVHILPYRRIVSTLLAALCLVLLVDWISIPLAQYSVHQEGEADTALIGNWRGIHNGKNEAGAFCAMAIILFVYEGMRRWSYMIGGALVVLASVFLYFTHSKTSTLLVGAAVAAGALAFYAYRIKSLRYAAVVAMSLVILPAIVVTHEEIFEGLSKIFDDPASLTGRVQIWPVLIDYASDHPFLGAGFGSFWGIGAESPIRDYGAGWITEIFTAHNGYLDLLVQIGGIGLVLAVICLIVLPLKVIISSPLPSEISRALLCAILVFGWLRDLLESSILDRASSSWTLMVIAYCILYKGVARYRDAPESQNGSR